MPIPRFPRAMRDPAVRSARAADVYAPHVAPINRLVDAIGLDLGVANLPYLDPTFGGIDASVLLMLKAPEADADPGRSGPRFLSLDNDDPVAARIFDTCHEVGLERSHLAAWNICPFPISAGTPNAREYNQAMPYNRQFLSLLPNLRTVVLLGAPARDGWARFGLRAVGAEIFVGASPSPPGINRPSNRASFETAMRSAAQSVSDASR